MKLKSKSAFNNISTIRGQLFTAALTIMLTACNADNATSDSDNFDKSSDIAAANQKADLYLILGQSNSAGRDTNFDHKGADAPSRDVLLFTDGNTFEIATQPLNQYSGVRKTTKEQGVNLGLEFGKAMHANNGRKVYLVANSRGGTKIPQWREDRSTGYFENTVQRVKDAKAACGCELTGILWHQGEGNVSNDGTYTSSYFTSLKGLIKEYRQELGEVPFLVGQLSRISKNWSFNKDIRKVDDAEFGLDAVDWVTSLNMNTLDDELDDTHFDAPSMRKFGRRYATIMQQFVDTK